MVSEDCVLLPRHKQQELIALVDACRELLPNVQQIVMSVAELAIHPELLKARTATIEDATAAIKKTKIIATQLEAAKTYLERLEDLTIPPQGSVM